MNHPRWITDLFRAIDEKNTPSFMAFLTEDGLFRYGSQAPVQGRAAIAAYIDGFFDSMKSISHELGAVHEAGAVVVVEGRVRYTTADGREVTLPFCNTFHLDGDKIGSYLIYVDPTPLAA